MAVEQGTHFLKMNRKYTANYHYTNHNFVIQNLPNEEAKLPQLHKSILYVLKNILQRGCPTLMSSFLQKKLGSIQETDAFKKPAPFCLIDTDTPNWIDTIKGDAINNYYPAKDFFEDLIPQYFGEYAFIQSLLLPECPFSEITENHSKDFIGSQVDFYLPQAKMVIEIDGQQHKIDDEARLVDVARDTYLNENGVRTFRISTNELNNGTFKAKIESIILHLQLHENKLQHYRTAYEKIKVGDINSEKENYLLPTAIIRFQVLLLELLLAGKLDFENAWNFNLILNSKEGLDRRFAELAIEDTKLWLAHLFKLAKSNIELPKHSIEIGKEAKSNMLNIDFSLLKRWTDEHKTAIGIPIFVRTDYFGKRNYFKASCTEAINYKVEKADEPTLKWILKNIFRYDKFQAGQFNIIANALSLRDTVGLLPTGGGKSLCYQLACFLQPSISFVVCPINALTLDQYDNVQKKIFTTNTHYIIGTQSGEEKGKILDNFQNGKYLFVWISPERFQIETFREKLQAINAQPSTTITYGVIDEVHCMSEWGHDFRTSYLNLTKTIRRFCPKTKLLALTATASVNVLQNIKVEFANKKGEKLKQEDICAKLDFSRKELEFDVWDITGQKETHLQAFLKKHDAVKDAQKATLIFTPYVNSGFGCYKLSNWINNAIMAGSSNWFAGKVPTKKIDDIKVPIMGETKFKRHKKDVQVNFKASKFPIIVATKAFGMGIDKDNIHQTVHYGLPSSVSSLYQEAGRAGRWTKDKKEKAQCVILHNREIVDKNLINEIFKKETTFVRIKEILDEINPPRPATRKGQDIIRQVFLFSQGQLDVDNEVKYISEFLKAYFKPHKEKERVIYSSDVLHLLKLKKLDDAKAIGERLIYRLRLLGIVEDWTVNFGHPISFKVYFNDLNEEHVKTTLEKYIKNYKADFKFEEELEKVPESNTLLKCIRLLCQWTFDNVIHSKKEALKTVSDWSSSFEDSASFKQKIDSYFQFTAITFIYQHIVENPYDYAKWFEVFYEREYNDKQEIIKEEKIYLLENREKEYFENRFNSLTRFIDTASDNVGINFLSGIFMLYLGTYTSNEERGKARLERAIERIKRDEKFSTLRKEIIDKLIYYGDYMTEDSQIELADTIIKFYPEKQQFLIDKWDLWHLMEQEITGRVKQLNTINKTLHEQLEHIA